MSGSGPGRNDGNGGGEETFNCATLVERTFLNSPVPEVVSSLYEGDTLEVSLQQQRGTDVLLALDQSGAIAGSLTPSRLPRFIACIRNGQTYVALVQERDGGRIRVEIRPSA